MIPGPTKATIQDELHYQETSLLSNNFNNGEQNRKNINSHSHHHNHVLHINHHMESTDQTSTGLHNGHLGNRVPADPPNEKDYIFNNENTEIKGINSNCSEVLTTFLNTYFLCFYFLSLFVFHL